MYSVTMDESATASLSEALAAELQRAIHALPITHRKEPQHGETVNDPHEGFVRLQDWAFTQGFALVKRSSRPDRLVIHCIHRHKETRNTRKTPTEERTRLWTTSQVKGIIRVCLANGN